MLKTLALDNLNVQSYFYDILFMRKKYSLFKAKCNFEEHNEIDACLKIISEATKKILGEDSNWRDRDELGAQ